MSKHGEHIERNQADWQIIHDLLDAGEYEQAASHLNSIQEHYAAHREFEFARIFSAARAICMACIQCRSERAWHQQANRAVERRETELRNQLSVLLIQMDTSGAVPQWDHTSATAPPDLPQRLAVAIQSIWHWFRAQFMRIDDAVVQEPDDEARPSAINAPPDAQLDVQPLPPVEMPPAVEPVADASPPPSAAEPVPPDPTPELEASQPETSEPKVHESPPAEPETEAVSDLVVYFLGPFRVYQTDELIDDWIGLRGQAIFKYMVAHRASPVAKDILIDIFWPDAEPETTRRNLHQAIYSLRRTLRRRDPDGQHIQFENEHYAVHPDLRIWIDFEEFARHSATGRHLETTGRQQEAMVEYGIAEGLYQGDFLEEDLYVEWPRSQREQLRNLYLDVTDRLSEYYLQQGQHTAAIALSHKLLARDDCFEKAHLRLMRCYLAQGQRHLAIRQYFTCVDTLRDELDVPPSTEITDLYQQITHASAPN